MVWCLKCIGIRSVVWWVNWCFTWKIISGMVFGSIITIGLVVVVKPVLYVEENA